LTASLGPWLTGDLREHAQPVVGVTLTKPLRREDGRMDASLPAVDLDRQVRAYQPWPGSFVETRTGRLTVWAASPAAGEHLPSGRFSSRGLATGDGTLLLHEVQPAGGRRMPWVEFLRGRPGIVGSDVLPAI
jgi:methionyl-tRNA formyltransferase